MGDLGEEGDDGDAEVCLESPVCKVIPDLRESLLRRLGFIAAESESCLVEPTLALLEPNEVLPTLAVLPVLAVEDRRELTPVLLTSKASGRMCWSAREFDFPKA